MAVYHDLKRCVF